MLCRPSTTLLCGSGVVSTTAYCIDRFARHNSHVWLLLTIMQVVLHRLHVAVGPFRLAERMPLQCSGLPVSFKISPLSHFMALVFISMSPYDARSISCLLLLPPRVNFLLRNTTPHTIEKTTMAAAAMPKM